MKEEDKNKVNILVKRISKGDEVAFEELYVLVYDVLFSFLKKYYYDLEVIKDVIAATFLLIVQKSKGKIYYKNCYNWILTIARLQLNNFGRKEHKTTEVDYELVDYKQEPNLDKLTVNIAFDNLTELDKRIMNLKDIEGYSIDEIVKITKLSKSTINRHYKKAKDYIAEVASNE